MHRGPALPLDSGPCGLSVVLMKLTLWHIMSREEGGLFSVGFSAPGRRDMR